jgi:cytochrome c oxidase assembly protein Cox11
VVKPRLTLVKTAARIATKSTCFCFTEIQDLQSNISLSKVASGWS